MECPHCLGAGQLTIHFTFSMEYSEMEFYDCPVCEGRGALLWVEEATKD